MKKARRSEVINAWKIRKAMRKEAHMNYPPINPAQILNKAGNYFQGAQLERALIDADILFYQVVLRCFGPDTVVRIEEGEFILS